MKGNNEVRFSDLFKDTVQTHGKAFAFMYYVHKHRMEAWEFGFWLKATGV